ncbi:MAG: metallophosphoesterase [Terracidiphilus sp.]
MKINIDPVISSRIKKAWAQLTPDQQARIELAMRGANIQAVQVTQTGTAPAAAAAPHTLTLAHSALTDDSDAVVSNLEAGVVITVGPDGVIWGTGKWQQFDPGWTESFAVFLESLLPVVGGKHPFLSSPQTISIPDQVQIGMAGDWGTGDWRTPANPAPSTNVGKQMASLKPDVTIHLGDVYYSGTSDQEQHLLVKLWPQGPLGSFTLNSNHEMYSGAKPYFEAISNPPFDKQAGCSFFALENTNWIIVGLDSAYFSDECGLYMDGLLFPVNMPNAQNSFLLKMGVDAQMKGKKLILLTHHNGLDDAGSTTNTLYDHVMNCFPGGGGPAYWYWGHAHIAAVYKPQGPVGTLCRCCGHGALPWSHSSDLANSPNVVWYENRSANDPDIPQRVFNGFAMLKLDGPNIHETFYDENGGAAWSS